MNARWSAESIRRKLTPSYHWCQKTRLVRRKLGKRPPLRQSGVPVDATAYQLVQQSRVTNQSEAPLRMRICRELGLDHAALANEGFVIHTPDREVLLAALEQCCALPLSDYEAAQWTFVSNRATTMDTLASVGAVGYPDQPIEDKAFRYHGFFPSSLGNSQTSLDKR